MTRTNLVLEEEQATEEAVEVGGEQGEVDRSGAGPLDDYRHEAIQAEHAGTEGDVQQTCVRRKRVREGEMERERWREKEV